MGITYKDFYLELTNAIPKLPVPLAKRFVNRALHDIYDSRQWSFLKDEGILFSPAVITSGSFSVTRFSNIITANAAAITALNNINNPLLTKRQIRFGSGATSIYNIAVVSPTFSSDGFIYLDRPYKETTNTAIGYRCYRCYYSPPETTTIAATGVATTGETTDFIRFNDIYNPTNNRYFHLPILPRELLDRKDPLRAVTGNIPYYLFAYKTINNIPQFEMWPHPQAAQAYPCSYQRKGLDFSSDSEILPLIIPDELLMERTLFYGCEWASKNSMRYNELKGINWRLEQASHKVTYSNLDYRNPGLLEIAQRNDEESYPQNQVLTNNNSYGAFGTDDISIFNGIDLSTGRGY